MPTPDADHSQSAIDQSFPSVGCDDCQSVLRTASSQSISFLLLDQLTIPLIGCNDHLEEFTSICGLTTTHATNLLHHRPAGGLPCPGCQLAPHNPTQPMIAVQDGVVVVLACPDHQAEIIDRFQTGLETQDQLATGLDGGSGRNSFVKR